MPNWKSLFVEPSIPDKLAPLKELSRNLWWVWNSDARELFKRIDGEIWEESGHNPVILLERVSNQRYRELEEDRMFMAVMKEVSEKLHCYLKERSSLPGPDIAYFSMEYGLHDSLKIFSGGLGILAGDFLKEASDSRVKLTAVGLLYRYGYFKQSITVQGDQLVNYEAEDFFSIPVQPAFDREGKWVHVEVEYPGRNLRARVWEARVGAVSLYLLDADFEDNSEEDRFVTHLLYGGDNENRLKQEMLLGLGGIRALRKLGKKADVYHCNEGHAAMMGLERMAGYMGKGLSYAVSRELVRASTLFTTHTPVPAGHDAFPQDLLRAYLYKFASRFQIGWEEFLMLGKSHPAEDRFNMSYLAASLSQGINGVSMLHGEVSKDILKQLYDGFLPEELEIGYVTNGVHYSSWVAPEWQQLHMKYFGVDFVENQLYVNRWAGIYRAPDAEIWKLKKQLKAVLIDSIKKGCMAGGMHLHENPKRIKDLPGALDKDALTVGFARRFAVYKRAHLLFLNTERLSEIVNRPGRPVQFIFAGKAHPADKAGQELIRHIVEISRRPEFKGKILFIQNYDIRLAKMLLQGVDVWLNTPARQLEASGTSGEKGAMNGTVHFSVLDGWWVEGYREGAGWALPLERSCEVQDFQDELDAETIYNIFEHELVPMYYNRNSRGIPEQWITVVKNTIARVAPHFTTARMIRDYRQRYYLPQAERFRQLKEKDFLLARELASWKDRIVCRWDKLEVIGIQLADGISNGLRIGEKYPVRVRIDLKGLSPEEIGLEMVVSEPGNNDNHKLIDRFEFKPGPLEDTRCTYLLDLRLMNPGAYDYALRIYPRHPLLPHRQDFRLVRWI